MPDRRMTTPHSNQARVALETTLLAHGVPRSGALEFAHELEEMVRSRGAAPNTIGVLRGKPLIGMSHDQIADFLSQPEIAKANSSNLGALIHQSRTAATTVSTTIELAHEQGIQVMASGGIGGVHRGADLDISADLIALTRIPMAVVCSGCKTLLDVAATREALETLGVPVIGFGTDVFPAFYLRDTNLPVDARFDDASDLGVFLSSELVRTGRGVVVCQPVPADDAIVRDDWNRWLNGAEERVANEGATGRDVTPRILKALHDISNGATLRANLSLVKANVGLGADLAVAMSRARL